VPDLNQIEVNKIICGWEIYKMIAGVHGDIVECGVFKGDSLLRLAFYRRIFNDDRAIIGFDTFGKFPEATYKPDMPLRADFVRNQGEGLSVADIRRLLLNKGCGWAYLIEGDICQTVPQYAKARPELEIALLNLDTDLYEPAKVILEHFYPLVAKGGIIITDNYNIFPGETKAVNEFCQRHNTEVKSLDLFRYYYIRK